jgi:flagella basal body P-ring formation protein FlgA
VREAGKKIYTCAVKSLCIFFLSLLCASVLASSLDAEQDMALLHTQLEQFLAAQFKATETLRIQTPALDRGLRLGHCAAPAFSLPGQSVGLRGSIRITIRCLEPQAWTIYASATVQEIKTYYVASKALQAGQTLSQTDLTAVRAIAAEMPMGACTDLQQLMGRILTLPLEAGSALRLPQTQALYAIKAGQTVTLLTQGPGFKISSEGRALANASAGQMVQVRTGSGQMVNGNATATGTVELR